MNITVKKLVNWNHIYKCDTKQGVRNASSKRRILPLARKITLSPQDSLYIKESSFLRGLLLKLPLIRLLFIGERDRYFFIENNEQVGKITWNLTSKTDIINLQYNNQNYQIRNRYDNEGKWYFIFSNEEFFGHIKKDLIDHFEFTSYFSNYHSNIDTNIIILLIAFIDITRERNKFKLKSGYITYEKSIFQPQNKELKPLMETYKNKRFLD